MNKKHDFANGCGLLILAICMTAGMGFHAFADAVPDKIYRMKALTLGTMDRSATDCTKGSSTSTVVPTEATLAFPGLTVADLWNDKYHIYGLFCGASLGTAARGTTAMPMHFCTWTNTQGVIEKAFTSLSIVDVGTSTYVKSVAVEYTNGEGGVYAKAFSARYAESTWLGEKFVSFKTDGEGEYEYHQAKNDVATDWIVTRGYGIAGLTAVRFPRVDAWLPAWENEAGGSVLTLDDVKDYDFHAFMAGASVNLKGGLAGGYNKRLTVDGSGSVTEMTVEFQILDDVYIKCVIVDFRNGANGVECKARAARFLSLSSGGGLGYVFMNADGSYNGNGGVIALGDMNFWDGSGYGLFELTATPPPPEVALGLDESKTWTQLVAGIDLGARDMRLNVQVTGENPVLTFDAPVDRACVAFTGNPGECTLVRGNAAFTLDKLEIGDSLTVNIDHALSPATVALKNGARIVYSPEGAATVTSVFTGAGSVEIASGDVTMTGTSDYTGGTIVKAGAVVRPGGKTAIRGKLYVGPFGVISRGNLVTVEPGGLYDVSGFADGGCWIAGQGLNPVVNTGKPLNHNIQQAWGFVLTGDTELNVTNEFGIITAGHANPAGIVLSNDKTGAEREDYTLRKTGSAPFSIGGNPISVMGYGTVQISEGVFTIWGFGSFTGTGAKFKVDEGAIVSNRVDMTFSVIENNGTIVFTPSSATNGINAIDGMIGTGTVIVAAAADRTARLSFYNGPGRRYVIKSGRAGVDRNNRHGGAEYAFNTPEEPLLNQRVDVEPGATFDLQGQIDVNVSVTIAGTGCDGKGALVNTGTIIDNAKSQTVQLTLADDASVGGKTDFGVLSPGHKEALVELGEHTLTIDTDARFFLSNVTLCGNGGFNVTRGTLSFLRGLRLASGASMDVSIGEDGVLLNEVPLTVRNLDNGGVVANNAQMITVTGSVTGRGAGHAVPKLTLADGATIKVPSAGEPLVVSQTLNADAAATYTLDLAGFELTGDRAALLVPPSGAGLSGVKYNGVNLPGGTCISVRNGVPSLVKGGVVIFIR